MNEKESYPRTVGIYVVAIAGTFLIMAWLISSVRQYTRPEPLGQGRTEERRKALAEVRAANADQLNNYGWVDEGKGIVRLPISNAVELAIREWQNPAAARSNLVARAEKAAAQPPPAPAKPNPYE